MCPVSPDDEQAAFEDCDSAAGKRPRRDSAQAAALTVGAPSGCESESAAQSRPGRRASIGISARIGIAALVAVSVLLIGVSAFALTGGFGLAASSPLVQAAQSLGILQSPATQDDASVSGGSQGEEVTADSEHPSAANSLADSSSSGSGKEESNDTAASSAGSSSSGLGSADSASSGSSASSSGGGSNSNAEPKGDSSSQESSDSRDSDAAGYVSVSVSVSSSAVGNPVSGGGSFTFGQGATAYDALCACGLSVNASQTQYGIYVAAIGGLAEKEHGGQSGWMYSVNGNVYMTACSNYKLSDGDVVSWYYVTSD